LSEKIVIPLLYSAFTSALFFFYFFTDTNHYNAVGFVFGFCKKKKRKGVDNFDDVNSQEEKISDKVNYSVLKFVTSALEFDLKQSALLCFPFVN
jgi:hypothetical protein